MAANGVQDYPQKMPPNAVEVATMLQRAGAGPDALANMRGGEATTLSMLVSSVHPSAAGVQVALTETLLDFGAEVNGPGSGLNCVPPLLTALAFGYPEAARVLARRGATINWRESAATIRLLTKADWRAVPKG